MTERWNYVQNPKFDANITDSWLGSADKERITEPPVAFPLSFTACLHFGWSTGTTGEKYGTVGSLFTPDKDYVVLSYYGLTNDTGTDADIEWHDGETDWQRLAYVTHVDNDYASWQRYTCYGATPATATHIRMGFHTIYTDLGSNAPYVTGLLLEQSDVTTPSDYADGDTEDWHWEGAAENSVSHTPGPTTFMQPKWLGIW